MLAHGQRSDQHALLKGQIVLPGDDESRAFTGPSGYSNVHFISRPGAGPKPASEIALSKACSYPSLSASVLIVPGTVREAARKHRRLNQRADRGPRRFLIGLDLHRNYQAADDHLQFRPIGLHLPYRAAQKAQGHESEIRCICCLIPGGSRNPGERASFVRRRIRC